MMGRPPIRRLLCSRHHVPMTVQRGKSVHAVKTCPTCVAEARARVRLETGRFERAHGRRRRYPATAASSP
jgi:hypothetical protein